MFKHCFVLLCLLIASRANSMEDASDSKRPPAGSTTYDQRQTGKYNVHVNIKDVQFFSLSDSLAGIGGDYGDYEDYGEIQPGFGNTDTDYDTAHLTVNPLFAFLGAKPATPKPTTAAPVTEKLPASSPESTSSTSAPVKEASTEKATTANSDKQDSESETKPATVVIKPAPVGEKKPTHANEAVDYEEIPVEVQYYRANQQKLPTNSRQAAAINRSHKRQPSVQIIDGFGRNNNVKIMENDHITVKICGRGEYRDAAGRCRVRARRGVPGL